MTKLINELNNIRNAEEQKIDNKLSETKALLEKNEAEKVTVLKTLGLGKEVREYENIKEKSILRTNAEKKYDGEVFYIDEIKKLCMKYDLRFLHTQYYKGKLSKEFPEHVINFARKHNLRIGLDGDTWSGDKNNFVILAPRECFKKGAPQKELDPLLFFSIGDGFYKVVYSWGTSSMSTSRLLKGWAKRNSTNWYWFSFSRILLVLSFLISFSGWAFYVTFLVSAGISLPLALIALPWWNDNIDVDHNFFNKNFQSLPPLTVKS